MAGPVLTFNESTGAVENSGCGPATAVTGTAAVHTSGASSATLTFTDTPDLSTVSVDDVIFLQSSTLPSYQGTWLQITAVDNVAKTVTITDAIVIAASDAADYGIGGKAKNIRQGNYANIQGNLTQLSVRAGWILEFETDQTIDGYIGTSSWVRNADGVKEPVIWRSADGTIKTFTTTTDNPCILVNYGENHRFENLKFENSAGTKVNAHGIQTGEYNQTHVFKNCIFGDATNTLQRGMSSLGWSSDQPAVRFINCEIAHCISDGIHFDTQWAIAHVQGCSIHDNGGHGIYLESMGGFEIIDTIIYDNGGDGVYVGSMGYYGIYYWAAMTIERCTIHGNTGDGIDFGGAAKNQAAAGVISNNITGNGGYGIKDTNTLTDPNNGSAAFVDYNNFGTGSTANTSGTISDGAVGSNSLTVDPSYTDAATADFSVGVSVKELGFPDGTQTLGAGQSGTSSYVDIGASQRQESGGGGGGGGSARLINGGLVS